MGKRYRHYSAVIGLILVFPHLPVCLEPVLCPVLPDRHTRQEEVSTYEQLAAKLKHAKSGTTILLRDGLYRIAAPLIVETPDITLRSKSGKREAVILDGSPASDVYDRERFAYKILTVAASGVTVADLSIRHAKTHGIHAFGGPSADIKSLVMRNLHIYDCGQHQIKVNSNGGSPLTWVDSSRLECSLVEITRPSVIEENGEGCYCGGIDVHGGSGWTVRGNIFKNIHCSGKLIGPAAFFWSGSRGTVIENNRFENNYRAVGLGLKPRPQKLVRTYPDIADSIPYFDHIGGLVRNNVIFNDDFVHLETAMELNNVSDVQIYHNTVVSLREPYNSIEYRWPNTRVVLKNNLVSHRILSRDSAQAELAGNLEYAPLEMFTNALRGDLHLSPRARKAINMGTEDISVPNADFDGVNRDAPDIGAYEFQPPEEVKK